MARGGSAAYGEPAWKRRRLDLDVLSQCVDVLHHYLAHAGQDQVPNPALDSEPLLRALTQLANAASTERDMREALISDLQVHVPLVKILRLYWYSPSVVERSCRLMFWLAHKHKPNQERLCRETVGLGLRQYSAAECLSQSLAEHPEAWGVQHHAARALMALCGRKNAHPHVVELAEATSRLGFDEDEQLQALRTGDADSEDVEMG